MAKPSDKELQEIALNFNEYAPRDFGAASRFKTTDIDYRKYNPSEIFSVGDSPMTTINDKELANAFAKVRYQYNPNSRQLDNIATDDKFRHNAGAARLYNKETGVGIGSAYGALSRPIRYTNYGHSERINMRDLLEAYIDHEGDHNDSVQKPSANIQSPNKSDHETEILKNLALNATYYQDYLKAKNAIVKMWSERAACANNAIGEGCNNFISKIFPPGSKYGYLNDDYAKGIGPFSKQLADAYLKNYLKDPSDQKNHDDNKDNG